MAFPLITDPHFYAVAIPAVLLLGISKSGFGAGFGSLAVPMMALAVTVPQAAAILMPLLLLMDVLGLAAFRRDFDRSLLKFLIPFGLIGTVVGTLLFRVLSAHTVAGIVGVFTLLFLAQRLAVSAQARRSRALTVVGLHELHRPCGRPADQRLRDPAAAQAGGVHGHHGVLLLRGEPEQVDSLRVARPHRPAHAGHLGGADAARAAGRVGGHPHRAGASTRRGSIASCTWACCSRA
jgi:hypothetical protein